MKLNRLLAGTLALVLIAGFVSPAFAQQANQLCNLVDFEGVGDFSSVGTIGDATFSAGFVGLVDADAGGIGTFANEPSPDTVALDISGGPTTVTLSVPVVQVSFFYSAAVTGSVDFLDAGGVVLATVPMPVTPNGAGDPTPVIANSFLQVSHNAGFSNIKSVSFNFPTAQFLIDDFEYCDAPVGGEFLPIDSTALILAGAQTNAVWIMSALAVIGSVAFGALYITSKKN